jgi:tetratricopeptide (TPR) repeat protein
MSSNPDYDRGLARLQARDPAGALDALDAALAVEPDRARIHANRALALAHLDRVDQALMAVEQAVALAPDDAYVAVCSAHVARCAERWTDALSSARRALALKPPPLVQRWALREEGWSLIELDRPREALERADDLLEADPNDAETLSLKANALAECERWGEALRTMDGALNLHPDDAPMQERRQVFAEAVDVLAAEVARAHGSTSSAPADWQAWHALGVVLVKAGELQEAMDAFEEARALHPDPTYQEGPEVALSAWETDCRLALMG